MKKYIIIIISLTFSITLKAQNTATTIWTDTFGLQDTVLKIPTVIDGNGNLYVAGSSINSLTGPDIEIKKYDQYGATLFTISYTGSGNYRDQATALAIDSNQNLIVAGFSYINATNNYDFLVLKYDSTGTLLWTYTYNGVGSAADIVSAIIVDTTNIYVTGASMGYLTLFDYATIKLNSSGSQQWIKTYNYLGNDIPFNVEIADNNIFVNGGSQSTITTYDYARLQYTPAGTTVDTLRSAGVSFDKLTQAVTDVNGNVYVTGAEATLSNGLDYKTIKFDYQGNVKWTRTFDHTSHQDDIANSLGVDYYGNVYVTGQTKNSSGNDDYCTIKYDSTGTQQWVRYYNYNHEDKANRLIVGDDNNVYITGESSNGSNKDFATIGYKENGDTLWTIRFNGAYNSDDIATGIEKHDGLVYVSGQSKISATTWQYVTIAYGEATYEEIPDAFNEEPGNMWYYPNNGQLANDTGGVATEVAYYTQNQSPAMYFDNYGVNYVFSKIDNDTATTDTLYKVAMNFITDAPPVPVPGAIPVGSAAILPNEVYPKGKESSHYHNFYLPHCASGVVDVHGYKGLFIEKLYKGINVYFTSNKTGAKHYFVINRGADYTDIVMRLAGADSITHSPGTYSIHTGIGTLKYDTLVAYEVDASGAVIPNTMQPLNIYKDTVNGHWHFVPFTYNTSNTLVIMAKQKERQAASQATGLCWSSYFGREGFDEIYAVDADASGNAYTGGLTSSHGFPNTLGQNFGSWNTNMVTTKFDSDHKREWSTFYSGSNEQSVYDVKVKSNGSVYTTGYTKSALFNWVPNGNAYLDSIINGPTDAFVVRFDPIGTIRWATHFGGTGSDYGYSLAFDQNNNLLLCGKGETGNFPLKTWGSAYYQTNAGSSDGFIARFDQNDSLLYCSFIGGSAAEFVSSVITDGNNNVIVSGNTYSSNFPTLSPPGSYKDSLRGGTTDDFICKFSPANSLIWSAYIGGSGDEYSIFGTAGTKIAADDNNNIYLVGSTYSSDFPLYSSTGFNDHTFSSTDGYIMKFSAANCDTLWSTYYSETGKTAFTSIAVDNENRKYIAGGTNDFDLNIVPQQSAYTQSSVNGNVYVYPYTDGILNVFNENEDIIYSTYIGGKTSQPFVTDYELIYDLAAAGNQLYMVGKTNADDSTVTFPTYDSGNGAYYEEYFMGGNSDAFISLICTDLIDGIDEEYKDITNNGILIYPNPSNNRLNIKVPYSETLITLDLLNVNGQIITQISKNNVSGNSAAVNIENIPAGIYLIKANYTNKVISSKFIKQ